MHGIVLRSLIVAFALWLLVPSLASAHAHLVQADPAPNSVIAQAPAVASFLFDEPLNPALTRVQITNAAGRSVTASKGYLAPGHNGEFWQLPLPRLAAGTYSVFWTSESSLDGHIMSSFYTFDVSPSGSTDSIGFVTGTASGSYGGGPGGSLQGLLTLAWGAVATAGAVWLGLMAEAVWLGAVLIELVVLAP